MLRAVCPDLRMDPEDVMASGDKAVARVKVTGTQQARNFAFDSLTSHSPTTADMNTGW